MRKARLQEKPGERRMTRRCRTTALLAFPAQAGRQGRRDATASSNDCDRGITLARAVIRKRESVASRMPHPRVKFSYAAFVTYAAGACKAARRTFCVTVASKL
jgi:hypothetical protein